MDLENTLEQEQEALVNRLWVRMEKLETEKRLILVILVVASLFLRSFFNKTALCLVVIKNVRDKKRQFSRFYSFQLNFLFSRLLQGKLDHPLSEPASPRKVDVQQVDVEDLSVNVNSLKDEVVRLRKQLLSAQQERKLKTIFCDK